MVREVCLPIAASTILASAFAFLIASGSGYKDSEALCGGTRYELGGLRNSPTPAIALTVAGVSGPFLLDYGATLSSLSADAFSGPAGSVKTAAMSLPSFEQGDFELASYAQPLQGAKQRLGIIGTDFLSLLSAQFTGNAVHLGAQACNPRALSARGLVPVAQTGFFSSDVSKVGSGRPNVPVVFLRLGDVHAWGQIDTGYADSVYPYSVDINEALYDRLVAGGVKMARTADIGVWTCEGQESRRAYVAEGSALALENERGERIVETGRFHLIVKPPNGCGGIAAMATPAAQLGASFLKLFGTIVFDPKNETVWFDGEAGRGPSRHDR